MHRSEWIESKLDLLNALIRSTHEYPRITRFDSSQATGDVWLARDLFTFTASVLNVCPAGGTTIPT